MRFLKLVAAAALAVGTLGALTLPAAPADAQRHYRGDGHRDHGYRGHRRGYRGHYRRGYRGHYRNRRVCRMVWRHGHRQRVCRIVRVRWR